MMEPVKTSTMHISETKAICSTLSCTKSENDEISKKLEDELLYGVDDDADEEDALSDDSLRLRLSDDEVDGDDNDTATSCSINNQLKSVKTESPDTGSDVEASGSSVNSENLNEMQKLMINRVNGNKKPILKTNFTNNNTVIEHNFCDTGQQSKFICGKFLNKYPINENISNYTYNHSFSGSKLNKYSSDDFVESTYGCAYYNNPCNFGRQKKIKTGSFNNNNLNDWPVQRKYSSRSNSSIIRKLSKSITTKTNVSADSHTSETEGYSNGIKNIDVQNNQDDESHFNNNNFTKTEFKVSDSRTESNSPFQDLSSVSDNSATPEIQNQIKTFKDNQTENTKNVLQNINEYDKNKSQVSISAVNSENENLTEGKEEETEETCLTDENTHNDINTPDSEIDLTISNDDIQIKLHNDITVENSTVLRNSPNDLEKDDKKMINNYDEKRKEDNNDILKEESDDTKTDDISLKQEIPSQKEDFIEKISNKRRLSESDEETNACKKVLCQEKIKNSSESESIPENVNIKICKVSDEVSELKETLELEGKTRPDDTTLRNDYLNGDSCSTDMEIVTMSMETTLEDENCQKEKYTEKTSEVDKSHGDSVKGKRRKKKRKTSSPNNVINQIPVQEKENVRQKRETAQKAQEMIRKLNDDSDSDTEESIIKVAYKGRNLHAQPLSPPSLKRNNFESEDSLDGMSKKPKNDLGAKYTDTIESVACGNKKTLEHVRNFFLRDNKQKLAKLTQEQLEELLIQKVIETITMRDEIGRLREQARISERNQEATRIKCQQLAKQIKDFEMVLTRYAADRRTNEKTATPIKINRSVGLQVSFVTDNGIQNLRQISNAKSNTLPNGINTPARHNEESVNNSINGRKGIKVRSPRRPEIPGTSLTTPTSSVTNIPISINASVSTVPPPSRGLVVSKSVDNRQPVITAGIPPVTNQALSNQTITLNGIQIQTNNANHQTKVLNVRSNDNSNSINNNDNSNNSTTINNSGGVSNSNNSNNNNSSSKNNSENLIDLTGEEEKNKPIPTDPPPLSTISIQPKDLHSSAQKTSPRYQRIIQSTPANVTIPSSAIRVIQPADKPTPTALVNNMNTPRLTLVMKGQHQLLIANPNQIRPVGNTTPRPAFSGITYTGVQTIPNGSVRVVQAPSVSAQKPKHPAALPAVTNYPINPSLKLPPPAPSLKISKVTNGIVLSWNMALSDRYAEIASYQLYAYQEVTGMAPSTTLWRKVGDVRALALPMACTLTQFTEGNNYYFAVRAVDRHSRLGQYSQPGSISL